MKGGVRKQRRSAPLFCGWKGEASEVKAETKFGAGTPSVISHHVKPPGRAAALLIERCGGDSAHKHALRELRNARRARSRIRFAFWAAVAAEIDVRSRTVRA
jgi:hypothetical protein